jgi:multidrug efflux pump subunit AcrB
MLVDNSIVVIENIFRHREKGVKAAVAAAVGTEEVQRAITASTLTTIAVFGPIVYVRGVAGELFGALSYAVVFSLLASLFVAVTLLPTMAARWDDRPERTDGRLRHAWHPVRHALAAGATKQEIAETIGLAAVFGGMPAMNRAMGLAKQVIDGETE